VGFGRGKGFSPVIPPVEPAEPSVATDDCQLLQDNTGHPCQEWNAGSQLFTPDHTYTATGLTLMLSQYETTRKGPLIVKIEKAGGDCWAAEVLWSKAMYSTDLPLPGVDSLIFFPLPGIVLEDSIPYRVTVHTTPGWWSFVDDEWVEDEAIASIRWRYKTGTNPYPRGAAYTACNYKTESGAWDELADVDYLFCLLDVTDPTIKHLDLEVAAGSDDCYTYGTTIRLTFDYIYIDSAVNDDHSYFRFLGVTIPSGATILSASIELRSYAIVAGTSAIRIRGIKELDTDTFSTQADADGRPVTDAYMDWAPTAWAAGTWYARFNHPVNLKTIIQEIIDQVGWASGNAPAIKSNNTAKTITRRVSSYEDDANAYPARLHIEYRE